MKKVSKIAASVLMLGMAIGQLPVHAESNPANPQAEEVDQSVKGTDYIHFSGTITEMTQMKNAMSIEVKDQKGDIMIFKLRSNSLMFHNGTAERMVPDEVKADLQVTGYYDKDKPMTMIYPPTTAPELLIVHDEKEMGEVKVAKFDQELLSLDGQLKLNIGPDTELLNGQGDDVEVDDLHGEELIVFYSATTRSIPPQTTPEKVVVFERTYEKMQALYQLIDEDHYMKNDTRMIPVRKVASLLGYEVKWENNASQVILTKGNSSIQITIGQLEYGYNRSLGRFDVAPELKSGTTYVNEGIVELLMQQ